MGYLPFVVLEVEVSRFSNWRGPLVRRLTKPRLAPLSPSHQMICPSLRRNLVPLNSSMGSSITLEPSYALRAAYFIANFWHLIHLPFLILFYQCFLTFRRAKAFFIHLRSHHAVASIQRCLRNIIVMRVYYHLIGSLSQKSLLNQRLKRRTTVTRIQYLGGNINFFSMGSYSHPHFSQYTTDVTPMRDSPPISNSVPSIVW